MLNARKGRRQNSGISRSRTRDRQGDDPVPSSVAGTVTAIKVKAGDKVRSDRRSWPRGQWRSRFPARTCCSRCAGAKRRPTLVRPREAERWRRQRDRHRAGRGTWWRLCPARRRRPRRHRSAAWRETDVDINQVPGTGDAGRISIEDVKEHAKRRSRRQPRPGGRRRAPTGGRAAAGLRRWGAIERQPMRGIRKKTAEHLGASWATIPLVTR